MITHIRMRTRLCWRIGLIALFLLGVACQKDVEAVASAPKFSLKSLSGETVTLKEYRGKVVVLDFWATWCAPCRASIPQLVELQEKHKKNGLVVMGISLDNPQKADDEFVKAFCEKFETNYIQLRADKHVVKDYFQNRGISIPTAVVIDQKGNIADTIVGLNHEALQKAVERLLNGH